MPLEDRIRQLVDTALADLRARLEHEIPAIAVEEQAHATAAAQQAAAVGAARDIERHIADAEARVRATLEPLVAAARAEERHIATHEVRRLVEIESEQKLAAALANAEKSTKLALTDAEARAAQLLKESVANARVRERDAEMAAVTRLLESIRGLDGAASLSEVLDALALAAGREAARAAVVVLRNERLIGWRISGFGPRDAQPKSVDLALADAGVMGLAVGSGRSVTTRDSQSAADGPWFAHLPSDRMGLAVPITVGNRVVAVVYGDGVTHDGREQAVPSSWPEVLEILARHAARCLEALTVQKTVTTPSPRFWVPPGHGGTAAAGAGARTAHAADDTPSDPDTSTTRQAPSAEVLVRPEESARRFARLLLSAIKLNHA